MKLSPTLSTALATAVLGGALSAQLPEISLTLDQDAYQEGEIITLTLEAEPFQLPILILGRGQGPTNVPGIAEFCVGLNPLPKIVYLKMLGADGTRSYSCDLVCDSPYREEPLYLQVLTLDPVEGDFSGLSNSVALQQVSGDCGECVDEAEGDGTGGNGGHAFYLPGIDKDLEFVSGGQLMESTDGTGRLTGVVAKPSDPTRAFIVDVHFSDRVDPLDGNHPPAGSPKQELGSGQYASNGGPIDPRDWRYYETFVGTLVGLDCFEGGVLAIERTGPAFQIGMGASGKNLSFGGSGWFDWTTLEQPDACESFPVTGKGDINVDLGGDCIDCAEEAGDHAITMQAFGDDFLFVAGGQFEELLDGTARLAGTLQHDADPANRWEIELLFGDRMNPGNPSYPPAGSPKTELPAGSYVGNGGIVDPSTWYYFETVVGTAVGLDANAGLDLVLARTGPAFQVGVGASGKSTEYGASGWLDIVLTQDGSSSAGDINVDLNSDCE